MHSPTAQGASSGLSSSPAVDTIDVDGLSVALRRKRIRSITIRIKPSDGRIEVSAPRRMPRSEIESFVRAKRTWIDAKRRDTLVSPLAQAENASSEDIAHWRTCVSACVPALVEHWEAVLGVHAKKIAYRNMKSRWGSCQPATGRICINIRLALYPPECLEYVVVHELCHLRERGHGPAFKALMDATLPDWRSRRAKLR